MIIYSAGDALVVANASLAAFFSRPILHRPHFQYFRDGLYERDYGDDFFRFFSYIQLYLVICSYKFEAQLYPVISGYIQL